MFRRIVAVVVVLAPFFVARPASAQELWEDLGSQRSSRSDNVYHDPTLRNRIEQEELLERLFRPVDVKLRDAGVRQIAATLARLSGLKVRVDPGVTVETRLSLDVNDVSIGRVLESVARQMDLTIVPERGGVAFKRWPSLRIGAELGPSEARPLSPWSNDWWRRPIRTQR